MSEPYVTKGADGLPLIVVPADPEKQLEHKIRQAKEEEFDRLMRLLKANNGIGAMTAAMWLIYEEAYYSQGYSGLSKWKMYLKGLERKNKMNENNYTVPTSKLGRFIYNWREWGLRLAWSMLTKPKQWEPVPCQTEGEQK